jgi:hypothetical protein
LIEVIMPLLMCTVCDMRVTPSPTSMTLALCRTYVPACCRDQGLMLGAIVVFALNVFGEDGSYSSLQQNSKYEQRQEI